MRRAVVVSSIGLLVVVVLVWLPPWGMAVVAGWDDRTSEDVAVPDHGAGLAGWSDPDRT